MHWSAVHDYSCTLPIPFKPIVVANQATIFIASDRERESRSAELNSWRYQPSLGFDMHSKCTYLYSLKYATTMSHTHCYKKIAKGNTKYFLYHKQKIEVRWDIIIVISSKKYNAHFKNKLVYFDSAPGMNAWVRIRMSIQQSTPTFMRMEILRTVSRLHYTFVRHFKERGYVKKTTATTTHTSTQYTERIKLRERVGR